MRMPRDRILRAIDEVPEAVLQEFYMMGDADAIIGKLEQYARQGLQHMILWNVTGMFDLRRTLESFQVMKQILSYVRTRSG